MKKTIDNKSKTKNTQKKKTPSKQNDNNFFKYFLKIKKYLTKQNITYFTILLFDIILTIYLAGQNMVNYAIVLDEEIFISKTRYLLWGRNYINLITTTFFYIYLLIINKFFLHNKNTKKFLLYSLLIITILNLSIFIIFTKKIY